MNKKTEKIYQWILEHPGYLKKGVDWVYANNPSRLGSSKNHPDWVDCQTALKQAKIDFKASSTREVEKSLKMDKKRVKTDSNWSTGVEMQNLYNSFEKPKINIYGLNPDNVLFVADLHSPWILDGYLEWCQEQQFKYNCGTVIFSGDIIDSNSWSYHEHDVDGMSVGDELEAAKKQLKKVFQMFPVAISLLGNHDLLISRKAKTAGLSQKFIRDFGEVLEAPKTWQFVHEYTKDNVKYIHGSIGNAFKRAVDSRISTCQGHLHSQTFVQWSVSEKDAIFGLQVGSGFDRDMYAFEYAKPFAKKPIIGCGLILDRGTTPIVKIMPL